MLLEHIIQPCIDYAITIWGFSDQSNVNKVQHIQNYMAREIVGNFDYIGIRGLDLVRQLGWMPVNTRRKYFTLLTFYKIVYGLCPNYLGDLITYNTDVNVHNTRSHPLSLYVTPTTTSVCYSYHRTSFKSAFLDVTVILFK